MFDPYPYRVTKAPPDDADKPPRWQIIGGWLTCLTLLALLTITAIGMLLFLGYLAWELWPT